MVIRPLTLLSLCTVLLETAQAAPETPDRWALQQIQQTPAQLGTEVVVAVIDSGLDYHHPDIDAAKIWRNDLDPPNGVDDDGNGYVDDLIGWDFVDGDNNPWDHHGHGTFVTGLIAATRDNDIGIDGVSNNVRIMPLRALNSGGFGDGMALAQAVFYAIEHGATVINLSLGRRGLDVVDVAITRYAKEQDVVLVVAAGNQAANVDEFGPAGINDNDRTTLIVSATDPSDRVAGFSNQGPLVDVAAPGVELLSLRARRTDFNWVSQIDDYHPGQGFVGPNAQLYKSSGTSFAAPLVAGLAAELRARNPSLDAASIIRMIKQSAVDVSDPGIDYKSGYGRIDVAAALSAKPSYFIDADISGLRVVQAKNGLAVEVSGSADADAFKSAKLMLGAGEQPQSWAKKSYKVTPTTRDTLALIDAKDLQGAGTWTLRLIVQHKSGNQRERRFLLNLN